MSTGGLVSSSTLLSACSEGLDVEDAPPAIEHLLRRQIVLIEQRDTSCHSMSELLVEPTVN